MPESDSTPVINLIQKDKKNNFRICERSIVNIKYKSNIHTNDLILLKRNEYFSTSVQKRDC